MAAKDDLGRAGEDRAAHYLIERGFDIVDRNWRAPGGELDLVAQRGRVLAVVEVKTRRGDGFGDPLLAVDARKLSRLRHLALAWRAAHPAESRGRELRIDVIGISGPDPATARLEHVEGVW